MRAAVYLRRSTEDHQADSLHTQREQALRFIAERGWTAADEHIFVDDAVSRAEFQKRKALPALLNAVERRAVDVVVTRDESRLGGEMARTTLLIQDILDSGAQLFYYASGERVRLDDATAKFMMAARNYASELEREKTAQRTYESHLVKARKGLCVGGKVFGYKNVEVMDGDRRRVEYAIDEGEAEVVREIFRSYAANLGVRAIAKALNERGVPSPRAGKRGTGSWSPSSVWGVLHNVRYRGELVWNRREKTYKKGTKVRVARDHLRIVSDDQWQAAQRGAARAAPDDARKPRQGGRPFRYLLSGILRCGQCGGALTVINGRHGDLPIKVYACAYHRDRGSAVCTNAARRPMEAVNAVLVGWLQAHVLSEELVAATVLEVERRLRERTPGPGIAALDQEVTALRGEIQRLAEAIATSSTKPEALVRAIDERQEKLQKAEARLRAAKAAPEAIAFELARIRREARRRITELQKTLEADPVLGRKVIEAVFQGSLRATPIATADGPRFQIEGTATIGPVLAAEGGVSNPPSSFASPAGFECAHRACFRGFRGSQPG